MERFTVAGPGARSQADLEQHCGDIQYIIFKNNVTLDKLKYDTVDASVFAFKAPDKTADPTQDQPLSLIIQTDDPTKADPKAMFSTYPFIMMAQLGSHYENRAWFAFDVDVNDYCWQAPILQHAPALNFTFIDLLQPLTLNFRPWESRMTYRSQRQGV